jgi:hypothetical protein
MRGLDPRIPTATGATKPAVTAGNAADAADTVDPSLSGGT